MVIKPKIRGFICTNAHPAGCAEHVNEQIAYVKSNGPVENGPKNVLVIGASTGYGLASRITATFGSGASTLGIFFEKEGTEKRTGSAGWYNSAAFHTEAKKQAYGLKVLMAMHSLMRLKLKQLKQLKLKWAKLI